MNTALSLSVVEGEPRVHDLLLAEHLGFAQPRDIRKIIKRNDAKLLKFGQRATVARRIEGGNGTTQEIQEYYLNQKQAIFICMKSETEKAFDVQIEIVRVFDAFLQKENEAGRPRFRPEKTRKALPGGLTVEQQDAVKALIKSRVEILAHDRQAKAAVTCWSSIKSKFGVGYKQVPTECFGDVLSLVARLELDKPAALPRPDGRYCFPASFWKVAPHDRAGFLTWQDLVNARPRPLPDLFARLAEDGHDIEGARIEYLAMRHIMELQNLILSNVARDVLSYPHRGLGFDFR